LLYFGIAGLSNPSGTALFAQELTAALAGTCLLAGLWTPVMGALAAIDEAWIAVTTSSPAREDTWIHILLSILAVSLAMLGPGAWSIDARLFGRKRFDIDRSSGRKSPSQKSGAID